MKYEQKERWYRAEKADAPNLLIAECEKAIQNNGQRRAEALRFCSLFEGMSVGSFADGGYVNDNDEVFDGLDIPIVRNTCRSIVQTAVSKITAQDSPLPQFMSNGGDWQMRTKAVRLDRLVTAEYGRQQGCFSNLHEMFRHGASIAMAATGSFAVFYRADVDGLTAELDDTLTLGIERSGRFGRIIALVRTTWYSAEDLIERYPKHEDEILENECQADLVVEDPRTNEATPQRGVRVYQGWRSARGETAGRYMCVLKDGTVLHDDDFDRDCPPMAMWHYERSLYGQWGASMTRSIYNQVMRVNQIIADVDYAERNSPQGLVMHKKGTTREGDLDKARGWQFVEIQGAGDMSEAFHVVTPPKFSQDSLGLLQFHEQGAHDISGVSDQHTSAKRSVGTTSGKHENMVAALFTERFADAERRLIDVRTTVSARFIVWTLQDVLESNPDYAARYVKGDYIEEIKLADLDLDEEQYCLTVAPVSEDKQSPKARLEKMDQAFEAGLITGSELLSFQQDFDEKQRTSLAVAQEEWLERQVDAWQHAEGVEYQGPIPWMDLQSAAKTVAQHLLVARSKGLPDDRLLYFTRFLDEVQAYISQTSAPAAAAGALGPGGAGPDGMLSAMAGAPPAGPPGGMPMPA